MPLNLYRRHRQECEAGHDAESRSGEFEERKKGLEEMFLLLFASGTLGGSFKRNYTGKSSWDEAKTVTAVWEEAQSWNGKTLPQPAPEPPNDSKPSRITLADAIKVFLTNREGTKIAPATLRKYKTFTKQLTDFADTRGYVMLDQFTSSDMDIFYSGLTLGIRAKAKRLGTIRSFFRFCINRKWITENPVSSDIKPPIGANRVTNKVPFTDDELQRIIAACDRVGEVAWMNGRDSGVWTGEDVRILSG